MNRIDMVMDEAAKLYQKRFAESCQEIQRELEKKWDRLEEELRVLLEQLAWKAKAMHQDGRKGMGKYLMISHLYSSFLSGSYEYRIEILDENMYLDQQECCDYWSPSILIPYIEGDHEYLRKAMSERYVRLREYESAKVIRDYQFFYHSLVFEIFSHLKERIEILNDYQLLYGEFMGEAIPI